MSILNLCESFTNEFYTLLAERAPKASFQLLKASYDVKVAQLGRKKDKHAFDMLYMSLSNLKIIRFLVLAYEHDGNLYTVDKGVSRSNDFSVERLLERDYSSSDWDCMKHYVVYQTTDSEISDRLSKGLPPFAVYSKQ